jgi:hypothetical protein
MPTSVLAWLKKHGSGDTSTPTIGPPTQSIDTLPASTSQRNMGLGGPAQHRPTSRFNDANDRPGAATTSALPMSGAQRIEVEAATGDINTTAHRLTSAVSSDFSVITRAEQNEALFLQEAGLTPDTVTKHAKAWTMWITFLASREGAASPDPFMRQVTQRECSILIGLWLTWLRRTHNTRASHLGPMLSHLKSNWRTANITSLFPSSTTEDEFDRILKALGPTEDEQREILEEKRDNIKLPMPPQLVWDLREEVMQGLSSSGGGWAAAPTMDRIGGYMGVVLAAESAQRGVNWVYKRNSSSIVIKTSDVRFQMGVGEEDDDGLHNNLREFKGDEARTFLLQGGATSACTARLNRIREVRLDFMKDKMGKSSANMLIARRTPEEAQIIEDLGMWLCLSGTTDKDPFLIRYAKGKKGAIGRRMITPSDCSSIVKLAANRADLPAKHFSLKSTRSGATTAMASAGADKNTIHSRTGHSSKSRVSDSHYNFQASSNSGGRGASEGPAALSRDNTFGVEQLAQLIPHEKCDQHDTANSLTQGVETAGSDQVSTAVTTQVQGGKLNERGRGKRGKGIKARNKAMISNDTQVIHPERSSGVSNI